MRNWLLCLLLGVSLPLLAQQATDKAPRQEEAAEGAADDAAAAADAAAVDDAIDETGLDDQGYRGEDDDDFVPSEDIPTDQSIPFPTDI